MPTLGDFDFIKVLGTGGFATVYMGKWTHGCLFGSSNDLRVRLYGELVFD